MRVCTSVLMGLVALCLLATELPAQTVLTDIWRDKEYRNTAGKVAVFWVVRDRARRMLLEDEFVHQLKTRGTGGMPGYVVIPPEKMVDRETAREKVRVLGADAVLAVRLIDRETAQENIPEPAHGGNGPSLGAGFYEYVYDPPARSGEGPVYLETTLFDVRTGRRVWAARLVTGIDAADKKVLVDFIGTIIERLSGAKMIR